jgi:hypothetical protein
MLKAYYANYILQCTGNVRGKVIDQCAARPACNTYLEEASPFPVVPLYAIMDHRTTGRKQQLAAYFSLLLRMPLR